MMSAFPCFAATSIRHVIGGIVALAVVLMAAEASAVPLTLVQTGTNHTSFSSFTDSQTTQSLAFIDSGTATASMNPFNPALGTLDKVTISWSLGQSFTGTTGAGGGGVTQNIAGTALVNAISYNGGGDGATNSAGASSPLSSIQPDKTFTNEFTAAQAGVTYDPAIWAAITGASPYSVSFVGPAIYLNYYGIASGTATTYRDVTVTYEYTGSAVPEIDPAGAGSILAFVAGVLGLVERRRLKVA